ncbi:proteasome assembly chaperone 3-like isoform X1 [Xenia sp. Carnegie-2017]|uniref:proteasome assembly chaperone 3-like isoform X1 n=1 Tax=Xenia sp. Carnegie-2017 TaxID=2897299 RepID=UPI001F043B92|nr:proteasome assembly chaperone 3-like isoform X1 [Xenia sp. Carnegie-2017]XP_046849262.1 proteasome assembly chaperone 3-like isoform X1 [Xenia sp. Carnegie-2017]
MERDLESWSNMAENSKPLIYTKQLTLEINHVSTSLICSNFGDKYFILVTQYGKIGTLVQIGEKCLINSGNVENIDMKVLLGKDEPLTYVYAKQIAKCLFASGVHFPILLGIALKDDTPETLKQLVRKINDADLFSSHVDGSMNTWAQ